MGYKTFVCHYCKKENGIGWCIVHKGHYFCSRRCVIRWDIDHDDTSPD
jgi:hypothetical protein